MSETKNEAPAGRVPEPPEEAVYVTGARGRVWWRQGYTAGAAAREALVAVVGGGDFWYAMVWGREPIEAPGAHRAVQVLVLDAEGGQAPGRLTPAEAPAKAAAQGRPYPYARAGA